MQSMKYFNHMIKAPGFAPDKATHRKTLSLSTIDPNQKAPNRTVNSSGFIRPADWTVVKN